MKTIQAFSKKEMVISNLEQLRLVGGSDPKPRVTRVVIVKKPN